MLKSDARDYSRYPRQLHVAAAVWHLPGVTAGRVALMFAERFRAAVLGLRMDTVARAIELARQGHCHTLDEIRRRLKAEGYANVSEHTAGSMIKRQLCALIRDAPGRASSGS